MEATTLTQTKNLQWKSLLHLTVLADLAVLVFMAINQGDNLALGLGVIIIAGLALTRLRHAWVGVVLLGLIFADITLWTVSGAANNFLHGDRGLSLLLPASLGIISLTGMVSALASLFSRHKPGEFSRTPSAVAGISLAFLALAAAASLLVRTPQATLEQAENIALGTKNMVYSSAALKADTGEITLTLANEDLWWHTFTIDEFGIDLQVPMGAERSITFNAPPGEYEFYCSIPGHEAIGMHGTLKVEE